MVEVIAELSEAGVTFTARTTTARRWFGLRHSDSVTLATGDWTREDHALAHAIAALRRIGESREGAVLFEDDRIVADHGAVAALDSSAARILGLPATVPFAFQADTRGVIGKESFLLTGAWIEGGREVPARRNGAFLKAGSGEFRIPEPIYSAIELAAAFDAGAVDLPEHWNALARFRAMLDPETRGDVEIEPERADLVRMAAALQATRIYTASAFSLSLRSGDDEFQFDPVLFDAATVEAQREAGLEISEADSLLSAAEAEAFRAHPDRGFRAFDNVKRTYVVGDGRYVLLDDDLAVVLEVVRRKQNAPSEERKAFLGNPKPAIREALEAKKTRSEGNPDGQLEIEETLDELTEAVFQETLEYADRAIGIGIWEKPTLDFLPRISNVWLPETFAVNLAGTWINVTESEVPAARAAIENAINAGLEKAEINGQPVPATQQSLEELDRQIRERLSPPEPEEPAKPLPPPKPPEQVVVIVHENYVEETWNPRIEPRHAEIDDAIPGTIVTKPMAHQRTGFDWQIAAWKSGLPGILNADDQGLGKTFQTLAFLAWLRFAQRAGSGPRKLPYLVVAPTGLLRNWEREAECHLSGNALGTLIRAYGADLKQQKRSGVSGTDLADGEAKLDFGAIEADIQNGQGDQWWVLTSYETLANYQHSFRAIEFAVVIFDEIQKIKNVQIINANAAKAVKANFRIGLTGTPIENHILDLWSIVDALAPGRLDTMKAFASRYRHVTEETMTELHARLFRPVRLPDGPQLPPIGLRRTKEECLGDLPRKDYRLYPSEMPTVQAEVYELARDKLRDGARGNALKLLHHIRGVSLHPRPPRAAADNPDRYVEESARVATALGILDQSLIPMAPAPRDMG